MENSEFGQREEEHSLNKQRLSGRDTENISKERRVRFKPVMAVHSQTESHRRNIRLKKKNENET